MRTRRPRQTFTVAYPGGFLDLPAPPAEFFLVAAACCWPVQKDRIRSALEAEIDWQNFLAIVAKHRVAGLVAETMLSPPAMAVPKTVEQALRARARRSALESVVLAREAAALLSRLQQAGVRASVLKGATIGALAFGDASLRHTRDIDLLVGDEDVLTAHAELSAAGYRVHGGEQAEPRAIEQFLLESKHMAYSHAATNVQLELHSRLYDNPFFSRASAASLPSCEVDVGFGMRMRTLAPDALLAYLCGHGGLHGWFRLKWLADVASLLRAFPDAAGRSLTRTAGQPVQRTVVQALLLAHALFGTPLPQNLGRIGIRERWLVRIAWNAMTRGKASTEPQAERFALLGTRLSAFLLNFRFRYLAAQLKVELMADDPGPSRLTRSRWKAPWRKVLLWTVKKITFSPQGGL